MTPANSVNENRLIAAIRYKDEKLALDIISKGIDLRYQIDDGSTLLIVATINDQKEIVRALLNAGVDPEIRNSRDVSALEAAAGNNYLEIGRLLLEKGADPDNKDKAIRTAAHYAEHNGNHDFVELIDQFKATKKAAAEKATRDAKAKESAEITLANLARLDRILPPIRRRNGL